MASQKQQREYMTQLLAQPSQNICPQCYATGVRQRGCRNMVVLGTIPDALIVCCWLGDRDELSPEAFQAKLRDMDPDEA